LELYQLYFYPGKAIEQKFIENLTKYHPSGEQQLMFNQWFLETWVMIVLLVLFLQETLQLEKKKFMANI
jgi:hypothetical protein